MVTKTLTRLTINVSPDFRDELKSQAIAHGKTLLCRYFKIKYSNA